MAIVSSALFKDTALGSDAVLRRLIPLRGGRGSLFFLERLMACFAASMSPCWMQAVDRVRQTPMGLRLQLAMPRAWQPPPLLSHAWVSLRGRRSYQQPTAAHRFHSALQPLICPDSVLSQGIRVCLLQKDLSPLSLSLSLFLLELERNYVLLVSLPRLVAPLLIQVGHFSDSSHPPFLALKGRWYFNAFNS